MKALVPFLVVMSLFLAGCGQDQPKSNPSTNSSTSSGNPITAPVDYLGTLAKGKISAEKTVETAALNQAIQMFSVQEGRYPKNLEELVAKQYIPKIPEPPYGTKIIYDANAGSVKIVKQ